MSHRGPDERGTLWDQSGNVGLAHRRLSIIDLKPSGSQPMQDHTKMFSIVFNGEIYNYLELKKELLGLGHQFQSTSDTEVIIEGYKQWGDKVLEKLNGAFAFAIFDSIKHKLLLARDRAGEKPLFYGFNNNTFYFSSELKGLTTLLNKSPIINQDSLDLFLTFGYVPGDSSIIKNIHKLEAGKALTFSLDTYEISINSYWNLPPVSSCKEASKEELLFELETILQDSINLQLRSDVPVGILLSGGVDSSIIAALASRSSSNISTYTASFPGWENYDESGHAKLIADSFNLNNINFEVDLANVEVLQDLAKQFDEPISDSSMVPTYLLTKEVKKYCTVVLGGDGGDELFGGYKHYDRLLFLNKYLGMSPAFLKKSVRIVSDFLPLGTKGKNWLKAFGHTDIHTIPHLGEFFDDKAKSRLLSDNMYLKYKDNSDLISKRTKIEGDLLQSLTRFDFRNYLAEDILVKVDRASMLNSLEMRAPFLDYRLIEFAFGKVPNNLKTTTNQRKILLKLLAAKILPDSFDQKRKQGFTMPLKQLLQKGEWRDFFFETLTASNATFNTKEINKLFRGLDLGRNNQERLFSLLIFELWKNEYKVSI